MDTPSEHAKYFLEWLTLAAIILGPIAAVIMTRVVDSCRERRQRRLSLFKTLMKTRGTKLHFEHVGALNLVEIEFYKEQKVLDALEKYFQHLNDTSPSNWLQKSNHLFTKLLSEMARSLGYEIEQLQILTGGYAPQAWENTERRANALQEKLLELLEGKICIPITNGAKPQQRVNPPPGFPPPPD